MRDLTILPNKRAFTCHSVIETPKGRRAKFDYDPKSDLFSLKALLPDGMTFPLDFGFVPSTLCGDGDPLDIMVLDDEPNPQGALIEARLIGVIEAEQTEGDGVDAPRRHRCARVEVLNTTQGRRPWETLAPSAWT